MFSTPIYFENVKITPHRIGVEHQVFLKDDELFIYTVVFE